jgi:hypothetical protein
MEKLPSTSRRRFLNAEVVGLASVGAGRDILASDDSKANSAASVSDQEVESEKGQKMLDKLSASPSRYDGTVAVWFSSHYQVDERDWINIKEFGNPYHPLSGYYRSDDPAVLKRLTSRLKPVADTNIQRPTKSDASQNEHATLIFL